MDTTVNAPAVQGDTPRGLALRERAPGVSCEDVAKATGATLAWTGDVPEISV